MNYLWEWIMEELDYCTCALCQGVMEPDDYEEFADLLLENDCE